MSIEFPHFGTDREMNAAAGQKEGAARGGGEEDVAPSVRLDLAPIPPTPTPWLVIACWPTTAGLHPKYTHPVAPSHQTRERRPPSFPPEVIEPSCCHT